MSHRPGGVLSYSPPMPWGLKRYEPAHCLHSLTFSCYHRAPLLASPDAHHIFEQTLEQVRLWHGF
jgi:putative transposase